MASDLPPWTDVQAPLESDASIVLVDVATSERIELWAEVDVDSAGPDGQLLVVHPAISLERATTYAVGIRNLVTSAGTPVEPSPAFGVLRDRLGTDVGVIEDRRETTEGTFDSIDAGGVTRDELQLAWTFKTASTENTTDAILKIRSETLTGLDATAPEFEITAVTDNPEPGLARLVEGTFSVPNWMTLDGGPRNRAESRS